MALPRRKNGEKVDASWWNVLAAAIDETEHHYEIENNQGATTLEDETFDGSVITSVPYTYEVQRPGVFANGEITLQCVAGTWRIADRGFVGEEHGLSFGVDQDGVFGTLTVAADGLGDGTLKLKRRSFSADI